MFRQAGVRVPLTAITTADYGSPASRPAYSVLDKSKFEALGLGRLPEWQAGLRSYLRALPVLSGARPQAA